jgi:Uma2 family endonuclease
MTVEEFRKLPEDQGPVYHELRHGELVPVTRPKLKHSLIQGHLCDYLKRISPLGSYTQIEIAFRPLAEHELWVADVAHLSAARFQQADPEDNFHGAPDMVIEVLSPSNTVAEMYDREKLCLENGAKEFWVVDPDRSQVKVSTPDGKTLTWREGQEIPLPLFGAEATVKVDDIFRY